MAVDPENTGFRDGNEYQQAASKRGENN